MNYQSNNSISVVSTEINNSEKITKTLYSLPNISDITIAGTNRGNYHDRQNLGIYMKKESSFEIRQTNLALNKDLVLDCLNNDSQTEKSYTIKKNGEWVTVEVNTASVPFIRTLFDTNEQPEIEIRNFNNIEKLTYYYYKDNEQEFFNTWKENNHEYAVIENDRATFLVSIKDMNNIIKKDGNNYQFKSIDELLEYYHDFVEQFDRFIGLSYDTNNSLNKNVKTKFFVKANIHGAGAAYYGGNHTAQNGDSISGYLSRGWLNLHEFGHGYEGSLAHQDIYLGEVMNNILAHYFQITFLNEDDGGWLGKKIKIEENMKNAREITEKFDDFTYQQRLYVFVNVLDKIGPEKSMAYVHSKYRESLKQGIKYNASDMYSKAFTEISGYNVIPYFNSWKITPSYDIQAEVYEKELPIIYYLRDLVTSDSKAEEIRKGLNLEGKYSLVSNSDISKYGMRGNLVLNISIDEFEQLKGKKLYIKDGNKIIKEAIIENENIKINDLPVGAYTLQMPNVKKGAYDYSYNYVIIKENTDNQKEICYNKIDINALASDTKILLLGLGDSKFAEINMNLNKKEMRIDSLNVQPHSYFTDEYANVQIYDNKGKQVYEKSYIGNLQSPSDDTINIDIGYTIKIKHREASGRLLFKSIILNADEEFKNTTNDATTYTITEYGLQKEKTTDEEQYDLYKRKIDKCIDNLKKNAPEEQLKNKNCYFIQKNKLLSAILNLKEEEKNKYISEHKIILNGSAPIIDDIKPLEFKVEDELNIDLNQFKATDLEDGNMILDSNNVKIMHNIPNENNKAKVEGTYNAQIVIKDKDDNETSKDFKIIITKKSNPSEEQKPEEGNKPEQNNPENNTNINENGNKENQIDNTQSDKRLPNTGKKSTIIITIMLILILFAIWKYNKMKKIM